MSIFNSEYGFFHCCLLSGKNNVVINAYGAPLALRTTGSQNSYTYRGLPAFAWLSMAGSGWKHRGWDLPFLLM